MVLGTLLEGLSQDKIYCNEITGPVLYSCCRQCRLKTLVVSFSFTETIKYYRYECQTLQPKDTLAKTFRHKELDTSAHFMETIQPKVISSQEPWSNFFSNETRRFTLTYIYMWTEWGCKQHRHCCYFFLSHIYRHTFFPVFFLGRNSAPASIGTSLIFSQFGAQN